MAGQETLPQQKLSEYMRAVRYSTSHSEWWGHFMELAGSLPDPQIGELPVESQAHEGGEFTLMGDLVFEFRKDLHKRWGDENQPLKRCISSLKCQRPQAAFTAIATSGLAFHVYNPRFDEDGRVDELEPVGGLNLSSPKMTPEQVLRDLGHILSHARR